MLNDVKLSHKVLILPILAGLGFLVVLAVVVAGSSRSQAVLDEIRASDLPASAASGDILAVSRLHSELDHAARIQRDSVQLAVIVIVVVVIGLGALTLIINRYIGLMLHRTLTVLDRITAGDLTRRMRAGRSDEIGRAGDALDRLFSSFEKTVLAFTGNTAVLKEAADQLHTTSQSMSAAAEQTSSQASLVSASAEQVNANIQSVAVAVEQMTASVQEISGSAHEASGIASEAVRAAQDTQTTMKSLSASSGEIGEVVKVITSIAEQTNLLALNATIEAARAGDSGKGFAVVANEVKELARETATATDDIAGRIATIQSDTRRAIDAINRIGAVVRTIHDIQSTIATAVEEQSATASEIGRNISEAAGGSSEIAANVSGVAATARATSSGAATTLEAATRLGEMATGLDALLDHFIVNPTEEKT